MPSDHWHQQKAQSGKATTETNSWLFSWRRIWLSPIQKFWKPDCIRFFTGKNLERSDSWRRDRLNECLWRYTCIIERSVEIWASTSLTFNILRRFVKSKEVKFDNCFKQLKFTQFSITNSIHSELLDTWSWQRSSFSRYHKKIYAQAWRVDFCTRALRSEWTFWFNFGNSLSGKHPWPPTSGMYHKFQCPLGFDSCVFSWMRGSSEIRGSSQSCMKPDYLSTVTTAVALQKLSSLGTRGSSRSVALGWNIIWASRKCQISPG